jgi:hypothetical protein
MMAQLVYKVLLSRGSGYMSQASGVPYDHYRDGLNTTDDEVVRARPGLRDTQAVAYFPQVRTRKPVPTQG